MKQWYQRFIIASKSGEFFSPDKLAPLPIEKVGDIINYEIRKDLIAKHVLTRSGENFDRDSMSLWHANVLAPQDNPGNYLRAFVKRRATKSSLEEFGNVRLMVLVGANIFTNTKFNDGCYDGLVIKNQTISDINFSGSSFRGTRFINVRFVNCELYRCDFSGSHWYDKDVDTGISLCTYQDENKIAGSISTKGSIPPGWGIRLDKTVFFKGVK